jgi:CheY-like chemotaxis protein
MNLWLVVEDSENDILLLRRVCARLVPAPKLYCVSDGIAAKEYLLAEIARKGMTLPSLILSDLNMPLLNGLELLSWVKSQQQLAGIPFIILTSSTDSGNRDSALQLGADAYLVKPGNFSRLVGDLQAIQGSGANES